MERLFRDIIGLKKEKMIYLYTEPEVVDFTDEIEFKLIICGSQNTMEVTVARDNLLDIAAALRECLFTPSLAVCCWSIKNLFSTILHWAKQPYDFEGKILDLKVIEAYSGDKGSSRPVSYEEAAVRLRGLLQKQDQWKDIYKRIHLPLIREVVPFLENAGIIDAQNRKVLYAHYEIEGQKNGRFNCSKVFKFGFNPHHLDAEQKTILKARGENKLLAFFDFKSMEVSVLHWLSQDQKIQEILENGQDFYQSLFQLLTGKVCDKEKYRNFAKQIFLPVMFGMSAKTISEKFKISDNFARHIIHTLKVEFPSAMSFVEKNQDQNESVDYLGRVRRFEENSAPKIRNFVVQSPACTVCFEKLINLNTLLKKTNASLGFHVHDGYFLYVPQDKVEYISTITKECLEAPSELLPGLKLKVTCKVGPTLCSLMPYEVGKESNV